MDNSRGVAAALLCLATAFLAVHVSGQLKEEPLSQVCIDCICEATSNCNRSLKCVGDVCGVFRITKFYWMDAEKPLLTPQDNVDAPDAYSRCVNDPVCAKTTVMAYMKKFAQDCNGDGSVDCYDYAAIHRLGGYGCKGTVDIPYLDKFGNCLRQLSPYLTAQG